MHLLILPNQLFDIKYLKKIKNIDEKNIDDKNIDNKNNDDKKIYNKIENIILWEYPHYFTKYNYNKKKLILHRASMKYYKNYLKNNNFNVKYYNFIDKPLKDFKFEELIMFDPIDKLNELQDIKKIESPNFLLTKKNYEEYKDKKGESYMFHWFYQWGKEKIDILKNVKSKDKENRKKLPKNINIPSIPDNESTIDEKKYIDEAIKYIYNNFDKNYGNVDDFLFPITHQTAKKWLKNFIKYRFECFGPYQDAIDKDNDFLFHSYLSTSINIGLLNPNEIIDEIEKVKKEIPINSYEGYVRQLFWREYQRYCYIYFDFENKNYFGNKKKLDKKWYYGTLGIDPIDDCIKKGFNQGYLNHIQRLMIMGNFMNLYGIQPKEGFKWFMEFPCDSYEWVMTQNVLDMAFCVTGARPNGGTMTRPYISSSNYILKMSNYSKGEWSEKWNIFYYKFLKKNKKKLQPFKYYFRSL